MNKQDLKNSLIGGTGYGLRFKRFQPTRLLNLSNPIITRTVLTINVFVVQKHKSNILDGNDSFGPTLDKKGEFERGC